jgi:hypothetical protein
MNFDSRKRDKLADAPIKNPEFCSYNNTTLYRRRNKQMMVVYRFRRGRCLNGRFTIKVALLQAVQQAYDDGAGIGTPTFDTTF